MRKHKAHAPELPFSFDAGEPFALVAEQTLDGERIAREKAEREAARAHADTLQTRMEPECDCGSSRASWHGPRDGRRVYCCETCWQKFHRHEV